MEVDVATLIGQWVALSTDEKAREQLEHQYPDLFDDDILQSLREAHSLLTEADVFQQGAEQTHERIMASIGLDYGSACSSTRGLLGDTLTPQADRETSSHAEIMDREQSSSKPAASSCTSGKSLLASVSPPNTKESFVQLLGNLVATLHPSPVRRVLGEECSEKDKKTNAVTGTEQRDHATTVGELHCRADLQKAKPKWFSMSCIVFNIWSFLSVSELFLVVENTTALWRTMLFDSRANPFWLEKVKCEHPNKLAALLESEGPELLEADFRTIAMMAESVEGEEE